MKSITLELTSISDSSPKDGQDVLFIVDFISVARSRIYELKSGSYVSYGTEDGEDLGGCFIVGDTAYEKFQVKHWCASKLEQ